MDYKELIEKAAKILPFNFEFDVEVDQHLCSFSSVKFKIESLEVRTGIAPGRGFIDELSIGVSAFNGKYRFLVCIGTGIAAFAIENDLLLDRISHSIKTRFERKVRSRIESGLDPIPADGVAEHCVAEQCPE